MTTELLLRFADAIAEAKGWAQELEDDDRLDGFLEQLECAGRVGSEFVEEYQCSPEFPDLVVLTQKVDVAYSQLCELEKSPDPLFDAESALDAIVAPLLPDIEKARKQEREELLARDYDSEW